MVWYLSQHSAHSLNSTINVQAWLNSQMVGQFWVWLCCRIHAAHLCTVFYHVCHDRLISIGLASLLRASRVISFCECDSWLVQQNKLEQQKTCTWFHDTAVLNVLIFSFLLSLHQHMRRLSASLWRCHTTSFRLVWASRLLRASTQGPTPLIPSALTAPFYLCDTDQVLWMHSEEETLVALQ